MALHNVDLTSAMRRLADQRIEQAQRHGKFDNLPGAGKEIILDDMPADEDARMTWWCVRILRRNDVIPDEVRWRKQIDHLKDVLCKLTDESRLPPLVRQINELVRQVNTLGTNALHSPVTPIDLDEARTRLLSSDAVSVPSR
jgi:Domain of unknown function (DUF1992)